MSAVAIFLGTIRIEHEQRKGEAACPNLNTGPVKGKDLVNNLKIQMSLRERDCPPQAQAQGTTLDGVRPGNDTIVSNIRVEIQHFVPKEFKPKISGKLVVGVLVGQVLKADIGMPGPCNMGIPLEARTHPVADRLTLVLDLSGLYPQRKEIGLAHLGIG